MKCSQYAFFVLFSAFAIISLEAPAWADHQGVKVVQVAQPEVERSLWTIDARTAACRRGTPLDEAGICVFKKVDCCWQDASCAELAAVDKNIPLVVFFHGMWLNRAEGCEEGMRLYRCLEQGAPNRPFQFVIWSWPARKQQRGAPRRDIRGQVYRTETQAFYVAQWLETLPKDRSICMVGYSLGARMVSTSLHLLGGGSVCGRSLIEGSADEASRRPIRAVLVAAAIDCGSFLPGHRNGRTLSQVERILVTQNSQDRALKWYPALYRVGGPSAMGFTGPACRSSLEEEGARAHLEVLPVSCSVGHNHFWKSYLRSCALQAELVEMAFESSDSSND
jgi:hypothetical protein